jgi:prepilin-type N-terminal cleavage/methylation domain-containing protein
MKLRGTQAAQEPSSSFTLIELLVVISVITILAGIILPVTLRSGRKSRQISCANNLGQIGRAFYAYSITYYRMFPQNQPYRTPAERQDNALSGDDNLSQLYVDAYIRDLRSFNCPSTTDNAQDTPTATKGSGQDVKFKRSDVDRNLVPRGTQLSYEYFGEFNPGAQYIDINTRLALVAFDDDGVNLYWKSTAVSYAVYEDGTTGKLRGKTNHRGEGGNMLFLDARVEWVQPKDWDKRLVEGAMEWYRVTSWKLATKATWKPSNIKAEPDKS